jgi:nucleotide-binding universal stress UspA family protein
MSTGRLRSVLVGSDLSESSDEVLRQAARICGRSGAALHVVSAYQVPESPDGEGDLPPAVLEELLSPLPAQLRRVLSESEQPATGEVRFGKVADEILKRAGEIEADVIVLGAHRGRDVRAHFLGTTADEVLRQSRVACLVLRGPLHLPLRRTGIATDLSPLARPAFETAAAWTAQLDAGGGDAGPTPAGSILSIAHVVQEGTAEGADDPATELDRLAASVGEIDAEGAEVRTAVLHGRDVAATLARWADRESLDLLVLGTHGKSGWQKSVLGSVSSALARSAPCPVLLVPREIPADHPPD